ncbi:unnamed protein product [Lactuca saligna]|uniref:Uncharacterized protein n=1 Tax=Lactuca saligna TaxID=75948 RepID=A0AA35YXI7_LACSI|nr:unnamed protein product [Lactuca saligna]
MSNREPLQLVGMSPLQGLCMMLPLKGLPGSWRKVKQTFPLVKKTIAEGLSVSQILVTAPATTSIFEQSDNAPVRTTMVVGHFDKEPEQAPPRITIKQGGRTVTSQKRGGLLFMKNFDQNIRGD